MNDTRFVVFASRLPKGAEPQVRSDWRRRRVCLISALVVLSAYSLWGRSATDELGRTITVAEHPHRVICMAPSLTDTMYALGHGADVAGITDYTEYPAEAAKKPKSRRAS